MKMTSLSFLGAMYSFPKKLLSNSEIYAKSCILISATTIRGCSSKRFFDNLHYFVKALKA